MDKPTLPKGTRDFGPAQMAKRQFIFNTIRKVFENYGFQPLETPAMENLTTLEGKYGDEGDQLLFRVLRSGEFYENFVKDSKKSSAEERNRFMRGLQEALKSISYTAFAILDQPETRQYASIKGIIENRIDDTFTYLTFLSDVEKIKLKEFILRESVVTAINLIYFYADADITKENYREQISFQFDKFTDRIIIKGYSKILEDFMLNNLTSRNVKKHFSERGLRYDLTVPFARYVVMNRHDIVFPFKRYQIQPVWRADNPQKGRYREFYQCDADVVGTDSLICEAEIILMIREAFKGLNIQDYTIKINHRGILSGLASLTGLKEKEGSLFVGIDKLDKIGEEKVKEELIGRGFSADNLKTVFDVLNFRGSAKEKITFLNTTFSKDESALKAVKDFEQVLTLLNDYGVKDDHVEFDLALARGLSYYTGCIFEVKINNVAIGSVSGGGRYDNLTAVFDSKEKSSGVGISFGVDRIYDAMEELNVFPEETLISSKVLICHFDDECRRHALSIVKQLRDKGIASEVYPDLAKPQKQLDYANRKKIPFVILIGSDEMKSGALAFKNMKTGEQQKLILSEILSKF